MKNKKISKIISAFILGIIILLISTKVSATDYYEFFQGDFSIVDGHLIPKEGNFTCIQKGGSLSPSITRSMAKKYNVRI